MRQRNGIRSERVGGINQSRQMCVLYVSVHMKMGLVKIRIFKYCQQPRSASQPTFKSRDIGCVCSLTWLLIQDHVLRSPHSPWQWHRVRQGPLPMDPILLLLNSTYVAARICRLQFPRTCLPLNRRPSNPPRRRTHEQPRNKRHHGRRRSSPTPFPPPNILPNGKRNHPKLGRYGSPMGSLFWKIRCRYKRTESIVDGTADESFGE